MGRSRPGGRAGWVLLQSALVGALAIDASQAEGVVRGAVQVPAGGQPVLFLADHPVAGEGGEQPVAHLRLDGGVQFGDDVGAELREHALGVVAACFRLDHGGFARRGEAREQHR